MPTFRVKNLSVTLGEATAEARARVKQLTPQICLNPTLCLHPTRVTCWTYTPITCYHFTHDCLISTGGCGLAWSTLPPTTWETMTPVIREVEDPHVLETLRGQLEEAMKAAEVRGVEINEAMRPQTLREVEQLETELKAALDEIRSMKKNMS